MRCRFSLLSTSVALISLSPAGFAQPAPVELDEMVVTAAGFELTLDYRLTDATRVTAGLYNLADKEITNDDYGVVLDGRRVNLGLAVDF
ncbi:hypothetical protein KUV44_05525 [Marinobacter daepoensis]|uniref:TonB-dependent receptor-like beta-barrel domain-containing protein n=1 Tax=Marinobacter daepoensis TaxID=262077 RepID=A0ABS3BGJ7_9GAMM|nr:hypothetical protein [Marinobacter daepoensis]MBN7770726.1 hypothetical protein [Marinobacter daepoensis]MBY6078587.1 hypothetical protein [Marinobacter daepoensis]